MYTMNGAGIIIELLERQGITTLAGIPGGANLPLYDALNRSRKIRHILARHEQGAGFIAQGMARSTGLPGVCFATSGPGATNILTAVADAYLDSIPIVCITGQVPCPLIGTDAFQEVDTYGMSIPVTKHNFLVRSAAELLQVVPEAFRIAVSGRPGPVLIDIPKDVQSEVIDFSLWPEPGRPGAIPVSETGMLAQAVEMLESAERPMLYIGGGIIHAGAASAVLRLAETGTIPVAMTLMGLGTVPAGHPLNLGMLGMHASRATNLALEECDLLIAAGVRFDDRATGRIAEFCPAARVIHMDIDPSEISKLKTADLALTGDVRQGLSRLAQLIRPRRRQAWLSRVALLQKTYPLVGPDGLSPESPQARITQIAGLLDDQAVIVTDVGKHQMWTAQVYPFARPRQFLTSGGLGTMGFGLPTAIGAALACPDRQVVCFTGDGSLQMNIQELATAVEQRVNVRIIVLNNNSLGLVRQQQDLFYEGHRFASEYRISIDFPAIARGFGMRAFDIRCEDDPQGQLAAAFREPGPCLINIPIGIDEDVFPMVPPGAANTTMIGGYNVEG
ncbi:MAG: acetolactate synthase large subunit [Desulfocapsaceae bacterium]|nr:acetolactate synthase large subunit [Desulfocapsaceae bacterium]